MSALSNVSVANRLAAMRLPRVRPWALEAVREVNQRDHHLFEAAHQLTMCVQQEHAYRCIEDASIQELIVMVTRLSEQRKELGLLRDEVWDLRFADDPRK